MAEKISESKGFDNPVFDTFVPELEEAADIRNALELFFYGNSEDGNGTGEVSLYETLVDLDTRIAQNDSSFDGHTGAISDVHGVGTGNLVVGTGTSQTLTNKTLTSPVITGGTINGGAALIVDSTELNYVDGATSSIQTQINTNTPIGMISPYSGSASPVGWLLCDGGSYSVTTYANLFSVIGYTFGGASENFNVPNLKGRVVVGTDSSQTQFDTRGETGGNINHQHESSNSGSTSVAHNHTIPALSGSAAGAGAHGHTVSGTHTHSINHSHADNFNPATYANHGHSDNFSTSQNNAYLKVSSGSSSLNVASGQHTHPVAGSVSGGGEHDHNFGGSVTDSNANSGPTSANFNAADNSNHAHNIGTNASATIDGAGGSHTHTTPASNEISNLQPYIALNYIIKI